MSDHTIGIICAYDGRAANVGRIVTDSSFHHYLDLNLIGDPCGSSPDRQTGFSPSGLRGQVPAGGVLDDLQQFYVNTVTWLAKPNPNFYFVVDKSTFSRDEASASPGQPFASFWLVVDGHTVADVRSAVSTVTWSGPFAPSATNGIQIPPPSAPLVTQGQRVLIPYSVEFANLNAFRPSRHRVSCRRQWRCRCLPRSRWPVMITWRRQRSSCWPEPIPPSRTSIQT